MTRVERASVPQCIEAMVAALKGDRLVFSLSLVDDDALQQFEQSLARELESKMKAAAMVSLAPSFDWWQPAGLWPEVDRPGWRVLLRKTRFSGTANAPRAKLQ